MYKGEGGVCASVARTMADAQLRPQGGVLDQSINQSTGGCRVLLLGPDIQLRRRGQRCEEGVSKEYV
jgi:hypothetical protein